MEALRNIKQRVSIWKEYSRYALACIHDGGTVPILGVLSHIQGLQVLMAKYPLQQLAVLATAVATIAFAGSGALAQDKVQSKTQDQTRDQDRLQDPIYGSQLMTDTERNEHRNQMRSLKTSQEREAYRLEHHKLMQERARVKGITLPEVPPAMGKGMGAGPGPNAAGGGMGAGASGKK
jgi:hypothetical protein